MQVHAHSWEARLLSLAQEARSALIHTAGPSLSGPSFDNDLLDLAYYHCESVTAQHSRSFYMASALLPAAKRKAVRALYAFCRVTDDIVDQLPTHQSEQLALWRCKTSTNTPPVDDLIAVAWADVRRVYQVPCRYAEQLIDGVARDLQQTRYQTFEELAAYSYGVASTVGLMSMHIIGYRGAEAIPYAIKLGVALQMTNILRDIAEDWRNGRVYLPAEELAHFGLSEDDLAAGKVTPRWRDFMRFQIERNRHLYQEAYPGIALLDRDGRLAIAAAAELYRGILDDIERHDYDVFQRRAHLTTSQKLLRLPGIWWRVARRQGDRETR